VIFARASCTARLKPCYPELIIRNTLRRNFEITFTEEKPLEKNNINTTLKSQWIVNLRQDILKKSW
jgi:hypothetical protein